MQQEGECSFSTPKKCKCDKPITDLDDFDRCIVCRAVHEFHAVQKQLSTVEKIRVRPQEIINFQGSE
jgi:hypothetical protein